MSIRQAVLDFSNVLDTMIEDTFNVCVRETKRSVLEGSELTGSKGVPVDTGNAKSSIIDEKTGKLTWHIAATGEGKDGDATYIVHVEENIRGVKFNNGGPHFFGDTIANIDKIFEEAVKEVANA